MFKPIRFVVLFSALAACSGAPAETLDDETDAGLTNNSGADGAAWNRAAKAEVAPSPADGSAGSLQAPDSGLVLDVTSQPDVLVVSPDVGGAGDPDPRVPPASCDGWKIYAVPPGQCITVIGPSFWVLGQAPIVGGVCSLRLDDPRSSPYCWRNDNATTFYRRVRANGEPPTVMVAASCRC